MIGLLDESQDNSILLCDDYLDDLFCEDYLDDLVEEGLVDFNICLEKQIMLAKFGAGCFVMCNCNSENYNQGNF